MKKDYDKWNNKKIGLNDHNPRLFFQEREVWFTSLGANIGSEQDGKGSEFLRPVIVIKKFNNEIFWGIPTTKHYKPSPYYLRCEYNKGKYTNAILSQLRLIDCKRIKYPIGHISESDFLEMRNRIKLFLT